MDSYIWLVLIFLLLAVTIVGSVELLTLTIYALLPPRQSHENYKYDKILILIPAHNEELLIARCIQSIFNCSGYPSLASVLVIADNCTDKTEEISRKLEAKVWVRSDNHKQGKGSALEFAFSRLNEMESDTPVVVVDADSIVQGNFIEEMLAAFNRNAAAIQCRNLALDKESNIKIRLTNIALMAFNVVRMRGRLNMGLSSGLSGNGFGLTMDTIKKVPFRANSIVEDREYHLALVQQELRVIFVDSTTVRSDINPDIKALQGQRARWEGGRFRVLLDYFFPLMKQVTRGKTFLLESVGELLLLPLSYHCLLIFGLISVSLIYGAKIALALGIIQIFIVIFHVLVAIYLAGDKEDLLVLLLAPLYILWKVLMLPKILRQAKSKPPWVRTSRRQK